MAMEQLKWRALVPVHDAVLIEAPLAFLPEIIRQTQQIKSDASAMVLGGFRLRSDAEVFRHPERYMDERGGQMWQTVADIMDGVER